MQFLPEYEFTKTPDSVWEWFEKNLKEEQSKTGLFVKNGKELTEGCKFRYTEHKDYSLDSFVAEVIWRTEYACFGYRYTCENYVSEISFTAHGELKEDFLNHIEIIE